MLQPDCDDSPRGYFLKAHEQFEEKHEFTARIFKEVGAKKDDQRRFWANLLFHRFSLIGLSLLHLCLPEVRDRKRKSEKDVCFLDHTSICAVGRTFVEAGIMHLYISELSVSQEEWLFRRSILELADWTSRYRMTNDLKRFSHDDGDMKDAKQYKERMEEIRSFLRADPIFQSLNVERQNKVLSGQELYLHGLRAAVREAGLNVHEFNIMHALLSSHAHSAPISFYRSVVDPNEPVYGLVSDYQYNISGNALTYATAITELACERMFCLYPEIFFRDRTHH